MGEIHNNVRAQVLVDALPYIQKYNNKILVVKYGGNAMTDKALKQAVMDDIVLLSLVGVKVVLVHGGGPEISDMLKRLNIESKFIGGLRYTDEAAVDVVKMVLSGKVNKELVSLLTHTHGKALVCAVSTDRCCWQSGSSAPTAKIWAMWAISPRSTSSPFWMP